MDKKSRKELMIIIEEQNKTLTKYKDRLHDVVESYKHLVKEKQALESSIKTLTEANSLLSSSKDDPNYEDVNADNCIKDSTNEKKAEAECLQLLKSSFGTLAAEKSRTENELRADRKKLLQEREEIERELFQKENEWILQKDKFENQVQEMKKKINNQQREREKEQQDHALMLKELQNLLANERAGKEKLDQQVNDWQYRLEKYKLPENKSLEYEKHIENLKAEVKVLKEKLVISEERDKNKSYVLKTLQEEMEKAKMQYSSDVELLKRRYDESEEKFQLLMTVKEKRIATLEAHISELSTMVGNYDKLRQQDQLSIKKLKDKMDHLQSESSAKAKTIHCHNEAKHFESETKIQDIENRLKQMNASPTQVNSGATWNISVDNNEELNKGLNPHARCELELFHCKEELEQYKAKAESALKEKYRASTQAFSDAKHNKEIKELRSQITKLQAQLQTAKSQLKLGEEYHNKITANLEKSIDEVKLKHKQEIAHLELDNRTKIIELEHQIQKQRERTLSLLEEKEKEIAMLKNSFLPQFAKDTTPTKTDDDAVDAENSEPMDEANFLSNSLILSKTDGHLLHYVQELSRKDIEISNLRHSRIQTETTLRKLQQNTNLMEEKYSQELESFKSRIKLLESSRSQDGTNVEYLKNVVLRFLKCNDHRTQRHMINAIATVLHFTSSELQEVKAFVKTL